MRSNYSVLKLSYKPVSVAGGVRKAVGGYLRYMQFRDQRSQPERQGSLDSYVRYLAHRDRTSPSGRVFGAEGPLTSADRRRLVDFVARSTKGLAPRLVKGRDGTLEDRQRAYYELVISPDDWHGLDLRRITRVAMQQLEVDAGAGGLGPWFAAEHRNTAHHHTQIVLAARREVAPGRFTTLIINRTRLQRMKEAMRHEMARQRGLELEPVPIVRTRMAPRVLSIYAPIRKLKKLHRWRLSRLGLLTSTARRPRVGHHRLGFSLSALGGHYRRQMEQELEREQRSRELQGWMR
jgi:hypothetical protein